MPERKYSVGEINSMRQSITNSYPSGVSYYATERSAEIEQRLRTYMQNGTDPEELEEMASKQMAVEQRMWEKVRQNQSRNPAPKPHVKAKSFWWR